MKKFLFRFRHKLPSLLILLSAAAFVITQGCPIKSLTGISCPGCGMTRALSALMKFDFPLAFEMHPLVFLLPIAVLVYFLRRLIPKRIISLFCIFALILLTTVYIIRLTGQSAVVCADFESGIIYRLFSRINQII